MQIDLSLRWDMERHATSVPLGVSRAYENNRVDNFEKLSQSETVSLNMLFWSYFCYDEKASEYIPQDKGFRLLNAMVDQRGGAELFFSHVKAQDTLTRIPSLGAYWDTRRDFPNYSVPEGYSEVGEILGGDRGEAGDYA